MKQFVLPDLGEGLQEAELVTWHVAEGDHVVADQPLVSVETEKAVVEVPAPYSGHILRLFAKPGDRVKVGAPLAEFEEGAHRDVGTVVGELKPPSGPRATSAVKAAPAVRKLAHDRGIDLNKVTGTGPDGTITKEDVERAAASGVGGRQAGEPLKGVRRSMAVNMARAHVEVVPATIWDQADIEAWWSPTADVTLRLVRAIAGACAAAPALNVRFDARRLSRETPEQVDLGIAVDTEDGLIVPVIRDIGRRDASTIRADLDRLKASTRARTVTLADLRDPTITLSNFGTIAGIQAALVIVPPQVAIVGAGRIGPQAIPQDDKTAFHHMLPLSLTFDHRVVTGGEAARFLRAMIGDLERRD